MRIVNSCSFFHSDSWALLAYHYHQTFKRRVTLFENADAVCKNAADSAVSRYGCGCGYNNHGDGWDKSCQSCPHAALVCNLLLPACSVFKFAVSWCCTSIRNGRSGNIRRGSFLRQWIDILRTKYVIVVSSKQAVSRQPAARCTCLYLADTRPMRKLN